MVKADEIPEEYEKINMKFMLPHLDYAFYISIYGMLILPIMLYVCFDLAINLYIILVTLFVIIFHMIILIGHFPLQNDDYKGIRPIKLISFLSDLSNRNILFRILLFLNALLVLPYLFYVFFIKDGEYTKYLVTSSSKLFNISFFCISMTYTLYLLILSVAYIYRENIDRRWLTASDYLSFSIIAMTIYLSPVLMGKYVDDAWGNGSSIIVSVGLGMLGVSIRFAKVSLELAMVKPLIENNNVDSTIQKMLPSEF